MGVAGRVAAVGPGVGGARRPRTRRVNGRLAARRQPEPDADVRELHRSPQLAQCVAQGVRALHHGSRRLGPAHSARADPPRL